MGAALALDTLIDARTVWRGQPASVPEVACHPTGCMALDRALPAGGWPPSALSEVLFDADGVGELGLVLPLLARLTRDGGRVCLVAPPYRVHAAAWMQAGVDMACLQRVDAPARDAAWAAEQCLRSGACAAVVCWPHRADDRTLRRLHVAAGTGQCVGIAFRDAREARNPSPAALRLQVHAGREVRVLKCKGGLAPARSFQLPARAA